MVSKLAFLRTLLGLGPKLPQMFALLQKGFALFQEMITLLDLSPADVADAIKTAGEPVFAAEAAAAAADEDEANAIAKVEQSLEADISKALRKSRDAAPTTDESKFAAEGGILDKLSTIFQFLQTSGLLEIIMSLLKKK